jgi:two-component system, sensor histidine kinase and response regulator
MAITDQYILIVDDSETNLVLLKAVLKDKGYVTKTARSAVHALKMINDKQPDLILLDLVMPEINGQEMLARLKSNALTSHIPVIIVSAITDNNIRKDCLEKGAVYYMTKPVKIDRLTYEVQNLLGENIRD